MPVSRFNKWKMRLFSQILNLDKGLAKIDKDV